MKKGELNSMTLNELEEYMLSIGEKKFRAEQIFTYIHKHNKWDIKELTTLKEATREGLINKTHVNKINIFKRFDSKTDDTKKYLFSLEDGNIIESVSMKYKHGTSICLSTQVGCKMACSFCASTKEGFVRSLSASEMLNQVYMIENDQSISISNIVLMGSGEPLDNYDNTIKFLNIIHHEKGHNIGYRSITLSTCGIVPMIYKLADENIPITLSISLHSPFDEVRKNIMPISNKYSIEEIIKACKYFEARNNRRITFEYTLIEGVNDREKDIDEISRILRNVNSHINLIALNPIAEYKENRPSDSGIERFRDKLNKRNIDVTIRREMGGDISASCGQLRRSIIVK